MKTLQDAKDTLLGYMQEWERRGKGDANRNQNYANMIDMQRELFDVTAAAKEIGCRPADTAPLCRIPATKVMATYYDTREFTWLCPKSHRFKSSLAQMRDKIADAEDPCRICGRVTTLGGSDLAMNARLKLAMQHDERGEMVEMDNYVNINEMHTYESRSTGEVNATRGKNVHVWSRPWDTARPDVWIAEDGEYAFLWTGSRPIVKNPLIKKLFDYAPPDGGEQTAPTVVELYYDDEYLGKRGYTHKSGLERAIRECVDSGAKVLNISLNPQYVSPGVYTWGDMTEDAALYGWIEDLKQRWLDSIEKRP